ncbi:MAG: MMPL family transporter, partial [Pseudomonadota bacterium]|nr:MMPL family transporter [Pseudomonadota bacterium]
LIMVPMGLIVDDGIHFFSRYVRAKQGVFSDSESAVRYAMASVGRPIWMTSWIVMIGLLMLLLSPQTQIQQASLITMVSLVFATLIILFIVPAFLVKKQREKA